MQNRTICTHPRKYSLQPNISNSTFQDYHSHSRKLIEKFVDKGYKKDVLIQDVQKVDRKQLLHQQKCHDKQCIPLSVTTYSRALPHLKDILAKQ